MGNEIKLKEIIGGVMFTADLAKITNIEKRMLSVQPLGSMAGKLPPEIHDVPLGMLGNEVNYTDHNLRIGDIILIIFTTFNMGNYVAFGGTDTLPDLNMNDYNNAVALPIVFNRAVFDLELPVSINHFGNVAHTGDTNREGNLIQNGNTTQTGNIEVTGNITATGTVTGQTDVSFAGISGKAHTHTVSKPEHISGTETSSTPK